MAGRINDDDIQALRERADIAVVVGDYTALKRAGSRLTGLCPFHAEKTPSFTVDQAKSLWHCFGCGEGGDIYGFLQKAEALSFPEAVERLARIVGYSLRYEELTPGQRKALGRRTRLTECVAEAADFYHRQLLADDGQAARDYLAGRGLGREQVQHFHLGWAPDMWDGVVRFLGQRGYESQEIADAGLATRGSRGFVDRFRGRVMFPILDGGGRDVVAFGGRVLPGVELRTAPRGGPVPKYINSPETEVYKKARTLYALNWSRAEIQRRDAALVVEGYMDVIGLHTAGVLHAVATCGTALTAEHFRQLERFARRVVLALDADQAGFAAADRARELAEEVGIRELGVLPLPENQDPADLAAAGAAQVEAALDGVQTAVEFQIAYLLRSADVSTPEGQVDAYRRTFPLLGRLGDRFLRYSYIRDIVAPAVRLSADLIERELDAELSRDGAAAGDTAQHPRREDGGDHGAARAPQLVLEREVLQAALQHPHLLPAGWNTLTERDFTADMSRQLLAALKAAEPGDLQAVLAGLPDEDTRRRVRALALSESRSGAEASNISELVARLREATVERRRREVEARLGRVNPRTDPEEYRSLLKELNELRTRRDLLEGRRA